MKVKGFVFDLDGVLVFTDKFHYQAWKRLADEMGIYFDEKINDRLRGVSRMASLEIVLEHYHGPMLPKEEKLCLAEKKNRMYRELLGTMTPEDVAPEVRETLKELRRRGYKLAIGSSSRNAKYILEKVKLTDAFDAISDGTNISRSKPDPEVFLKAAGFLGLDPKDCLVVEDAAAGVDAAKAGGMYVAGIGPAADYERADISLDSIADLLNIENSIFCCTRVV